MATSTGSKVSSQDILVMQNILKSLGVESYEARVPHQMIEFAYRCIADVLEDARVYAQHAGRKTIGEEDVRLAVQMLLDKNFTMPPPRELLMEMARAKNKQPLPLIKPFTGPKLPPDRYCLTAPNYQFKSKRASVPVQQPQLVNQILTTLPPKFPTGIGRHHSSAVGQVGSGSSPLIVVTQGLSAPTVTYVTPPARSTATNPPSQPVRLQTVTPLPGSLSAATAHPSGAGSGSVTAVPVPPHSTGLTGTYTVVSTGSGASQLIPVNPLKRPRDPTGDDDYDT